MTRLDALVLLMWTSSVLFCSAGASIFCRWTKVSPEEEVQLTFLRSDPRHSPPSLRLYHSAWSGQRALRSCGWSDDAAVIRDYLSLCRDFAHQPDQDLDLNSMFEAEERCVSLPSPRTARLAERASKRPVRSVASAGEDGRSKVRIHQRVKRGFIVPGTLWCGSGNKAPSYGDLGVFSETDSCCREHDQCKHTILSFHSQFGVFNGNIFTMSHCDCDNRFHNCLKEANDSISDVVGYTFFNLLKMHCFQFSHRLQCAQRNWFGMCKETKMALYADVHPPTLYESTQPAEGFMNGTTSTIDYATLAEVMKSRTSDPDVSSISAAESTVPIPSTSSPSAAISHGTDAATSTGSRTSERPAGSEPERTEYLENTLLTKNRTVTGQDIPEVQMTCEIYKDLDECRNKILPQQKKHDLLNSEPRTLYHCNCTSRLFQTLAKQGQLTEVHALLLEHVSRSCFLLQDCTAGNICSAGLVKAELPQLDHRNSADVEEQRHLQAVKLKVRRPNSRRAKTKDRAVRLHKLCLRYTNQTSTQGRRATGGRMLE